jgi:hypothetical protein
MPGVIELAAASGSFDPGWLPAIARISATRLGFGLPRGCRRSAAISTRLAWTNSTRLSAIGRASRRKGGFETRAPASPAPSDRARRPALAEAAHRMGMQLGKGRSRSRRNRDRRATPRLRPMGHGAALERSAQHAVAPLGGWQPSPLAFYKNYSRVARAAEPDRASRRQPSGRWPAAIRFQPVEDLTFVPQKPVAARTLEQRRAKAGFQEAAHRRLRAFADPANRPEREESARWADGRHHFIVGHAHCSHVSAEARERASPPAGLKFVSIASVQAVRVLRRCDGAAVDTGAREHGTRLERASMRPPSSTAATSHLPANYDGDKRVSVVSVLLRHA